LKFEQVREIVNPHQNHRAVSHGKVDIHKILEGVLCSISNDISVH
jgi:hypothetical protein